MANDSTTTSSLQSELTVKDYASPRPATLDFIRQFARTYSFFGEATFGSMVAN